MAEYKKLKTKKTDDFKVGVYRTIAKGSKEVPKLKPNKKLKTKY